MSDAESPEKQTIRILQARYGSAEEFLNDLRSDLGETGSLYHPTKIPVLLDESVILEILFPGLPNRVLLRGKVAALEAAAVLVEIDPDDVSTRDFLLRVARGDAGPGQTVGRRHDRVPMEISVDWRVSGTGDVVISETDDLGAGGMQIRTEHPPPVGTTLQLELNSGEAGGEAPLQISGKVVWVRTDDTFHGMGVQFEGGLSDDRRRVRELLRKILSEGAVKNPPPEG